MKNHWFFGLSKVVWIIQWSSSKFIKKKLLYTDVRLRDISDLLKIDVTKKENQKPLTLIETGTQSRVFFFAENEKDEKFQKNFVQFYVTAA